MSTSDILELSYMTSAFLNPIVAASLVALLSWAAIRGILPAAAWVLACGYLLRLAEACQGLTFLYANGGVRLDSVAAAVSLELVLSWGGTLAVWAGWFLLVIQIRHRAVARGPSGQASTSGSTPCDQDRMKRLDESKRIVPLLLTGIVLIYAVCFSAAFVLGPGSRLREAERAMARSRAGDESSAVFMTKGVRLGMTEQEVDTVMSGGEKESDEDSAGSREWLRTYRFEWDGEGLAGPGTNRRPVLSETITVRFEAGRGAVFVERGLASRWWFLHASGGGAVDLESGLVIGVD